MWRPPLRAPSSQPAMALRSHKAPTASLPVPTHWPTATTAPRWVPAARHLRRVQLPLAVAPMPPPTTPRQSASTALRWRRTPRRLAATAAPRAMPAPQWAARARPPPAARRRWVTRASPMARTPRHWVWVAWHSATPVPPWVVQAWPSVPTALLSAPMPRPAALHPRRSAQTAAPSASAPLRWAAPATRRAMTALRSVRAVRPLRWAPRPSAAMPTPASPMPLQSVSTAVPAMTTPPHSAVTATHRDISAPPWAAPASPMGAVQRRSATKPSAMGLHRPRWVLPVWRGVTVVPPSVPKVSPTATTARQWARMRLRPIPARLRWAPTQMHMVRVPFRSAANPGRPAMRALRWVGKRRLKATKALRSARAAKPVR